MTEKIVEYLTDLLSTKGADMQYGGEEVSQLQHALQCAELAEQHYNSKEFITAALLHDIGHLLHGGDDPTTRGVDAKHENLAADYLSQYFTDEVTVPIRAHVSSKRYLVSTVEGYYDSLSEASKISLEAQGGPFTSEEADKFISKTHMKEAVKLRKYDDLAKVANKLTPTIEHFQHYVENSIK